MVYAPPKGRPVLGHRPARGPRPTAGHVKPRGPPTRAPALGVAGNQLGPTGVFSNRQHTHAQRKRHGGDPGANGRPRARRCRSRETRKECIMKNFHLVASGLAAAFLLVVAGKKVERDG